MLNVICFQNSHFHCHTDAVVGTKRSPFCLHPLSINISLNGVFREIKLYIAVLLADHIHMALQNDGLTVFEAWSRGLSDDDISHFVPLCVEAELLAEIEQELDHLLFLL